MEPRTISLIRFGLLGTLFFFCLITLGLSGHLLSLFTGGFIVPDYIALNLAISVITLVIVAVSLGIDFFRKGAFTSLVITELSWTFLFTILWIATAGDTTSVRAGITCNVVFTDFFGNVINVDPTAQSSCHEAQALIAFSWLNFFILLAWLILLIVLTITAHLRGQTGIWLCPVNGTDFYARRAMQEKVEYAGTPQQQYGGAPVQQQYTGGQQYPPSGYTTTSPAPGAVQV